MKSGRTDRLVLLVAGLVVFPTLVFAHCGTTFQSYSQFGWVLLAEMAIVVLEAGLLRRFFKLTVGESYSAAIVANLASFALGMLFSVMAGSLDYLMLHDMAQNFWDHDTHTLRRFKGEALIPMLSELSGELTRNIIIASILGGLASVIEVPVYASQIRKHFEPGFQPNPLILVLINVISFPAIYFLIFIFGWMVAWQHYMLG